MLDSLLACSMTTVTQHTGQENKNRYGPRDSREIHDANMFKNTGKDKTIEYKLAMLLLLVDTLLP